MSFCQILDSRQKALELNLDPFIYGNFAEIGAGQEVARHFFKAGGAAGTMAKSISAYDMTMSDIIYGKSPSGRYVSRERLERMLDREFQQIQKRLSDTRSDKTRFFAFADTVAAKSYNGKGECHGWLGLSFQHLAKAESSKVILHVRMHDRSNLQQQNAIGDIGVNLIHACFNRTESPKRFMSSLLENLNKERIEVDMIHVEGPAFGEDYDSRVLCLELVARGFCQAALYDCNGTVQLAKDYLYKKNILSLRGSYRPPTNLNIDMLRSAEELLKKRVKASHQRSIISLCVISMNTLLSRGGDPDVVDFLARVDLLAKLNKNVLITNFNNHQELNSYLETCTNEQIAFVMGAYSFEQLFQEEEKESAEDGFLEVLGRLLGKRTIIYFYPAPDDDNENELVTLEKIKIKNEQIHLLIYLMEKGQVVELTNYDEGSARIWSRKVVASIKKGDGEWESMVPSKVKKFVRKRIDLFR